MKIDHIYCINLERSKERRAKVELEFKRENLDVEFFKACDGKAIGKNGEFGCAQSHISVWRDVIEKGYQNILILEDDIILESNFKDYLEVLEPPPSWDILYINSMFPIFKGESVGHFRPSKSYGLAGYILNINSVKKIAYFDADDTEQNGIDIFLYSLPLKTWTCNKQLVFTGFPGLINSEIGARISGDFTFLTHMFMYYPFLEVICIILIILLSRRLYK